jgi:alpha-methylacyl-CoA racemase
MSETPLPHARTGPLAGLRILEFAGIGPAPMASMLLADLGASILRIDRRQAADLGVERPPRFDLLLRNRERVAFDLKSPDAISEVLALAADADILIEGFRPGVMERLGLGPEQCMARNPRLVYGRMTGWGQDGPLAQSAGHDINYIAIAGALHAIGRAGEAPAVPPALLGDFAGGALYLVLGVLSAIVERQHSGLGQVVDAAIVDGVASLTTAFHGLRAAGLWTTERGTNVLDSGAPFYDAYECADGKWITVGPIESRFFAELLRLLGLDERLVAAQQHRNSWPGLRRELALKFSALPRSDWVALLEGTDACFAPVLEFQEAAAHPHLRARDTFVDIAGIPQPAPAPRFSRTPPGRPHPPADRPQEDLASAIERWRNGTIASPGDKL